MEERKLQGLYDRKLELRGEYMIYPPRNVFNDPFNGNNISVQELADDTSLFSEEQQALIKAGYKATFRQQLGAVIHYNAYSYNSIVNTYETYSVINYKTSRSRRVEERYYEPGTYSYNNYESNYVPGSIKTREIYKEVPRESPLNIYEYCISSCKEETLKGFTEIYLAPDLNGDLNRGNELVFFNMPHGSKVEVKKMRMQFDDYDVDMTRQVKVYYVFYFWENIIKRGCVLWAAFSLITIIVYFVITLRKPTGKDISVHPESI